MATSKDVRLTIAAGVTGTDDVRGLADELRNVGTAAGGSVADAGQLADKLDALTTATTAQRDAEKAATTEKAAARAELNAQRDALALLRAAADAATRSTSEFRSQETALKVAVEQARIALRDKTSAAQAAATAAKEAAQAEADFAARVRAAGAAAAAAAREQATGNTALAGSLASIKGQLDALRNVALAAAGGSLLGSFAKDLADVADEYKNLGARIKIVTGDSGDFEAAFQGVFDIAKRTGTAVADVGTLFTRLSLNSRELGLSQQAVLGVTEEVTQALQISGATTQEASNSIVQFSQAVAAGTLRGQDLASVLEQAPRLARAIADGMGLAVGQLKQLGAAGSLTSAQVVAALRGQSQALQAEFNQLPPTVGRALTNLSNQWVAYVGEVDKANGVSKTAAEAINALAGNLDTLGTVLFGLGKAAAAYKAVRLAEAFLETATAAKTATAATIANTEATVAAAAAQRAQGAATVAAGEAAVASVGRFAQLVGAVKLFSLIGVVTNLREIGTAIGEQIAKWQGYGKALQEVEIAQKGDADAARVWAAQTAALAQATQQATDEALGLTKQARVLTGEFDQVIRKGGSAADALDKLGKALDLSDIKGIQTAGAALDALGLQGKITGQQITDALGGALKTADLQVFATTAAAAFDSSEQGARRLQAALDAVADEALRRAGTSAIELTTGFSKAANSAIGDVDILAETLRKLGATADETQRALTAALDHAVQAATTERAAQAVIDRVVELGKQGRITGDALAAALTKAQQKLDDLKPGINSVAEAFRTLGLQTRDELQATADKLGQAYATVAQSGQASLQQQIDAYGKWRTAALAASGGVETGQLALQGKILANKADVAGLGDAFVAAMNKAATATQTATTALQTFDNLLASDPSRLVSGSGLAGIKPAGLTDIRKPGSSAGPSVLDPSGTTSGPFVGSDTFYRADGSRALRGEGYGVAAVGPPGPGPFGGAGRTNAPAAAPAPAPAPQPTAAPQSTVRVEIALAGKTYPVTTDAATAQGLINALQSAQRATGG